MLGRKLSSLWENHLFMFILCYFPDNFRRPLRYCQSPLVQSRRKTPASMSTQVTTAAHVGWREAWAYQHSEVAMYKSTYYCAIFVKRLVYIVDFAKGVHLSLVGAACCEGNEIIRKVQAIWGCRYWFNGSCCHIFILGNLKEAVWCLMLLHSWWFPVMLSRFLEISYWLYAIKSSFV